MIELKSDRIIYGEDCTIFPCLTYEKAGTGKVTVYDKRGLRVSLCPENTGLADQDAILAYLEAANLAICGGGGITDEDPTKESLSEVPYCRISDRKQVYLRSCKDEEGVVVTTDLDSGAIIPQAQIFVLYALECEPIVCVCTEMVFTIPEGATASYADILSHFENNGTFDDGSVGATGINDIEFGNLSKGGLSFTYNGVSKTDFAGSFHFGGSDFNDISTDLSITSNRGETVVTYSVYKCN